MFITAMKRIILLFAVVAFCSCANETLEPLATYSEASDGLVTRSVGVSITDMTVSSSVTYSGTDVFIQNVTVSNGATMTIHGTNSITMRSPFIIERGSNLVLWNR